MEANEITLTDSQLAPKIKEHQQPQPPHLAVLENQKHHSTILLL